MSQGSTDRLHQVSSETSSLKMAAPEDDAASAEWLATQFYDLHPEDPRQWQPTDAALQDGFGIFCSPSSSHWGRWSP